MEGFANEEVVAADVCGSGVFEIAGASEVVGQGVTSGGAGQGATSGGVGQVVTVVDAVGQGVSKHDTNI